MPAISAIRKLRWLLPVLVAGLAVAVFFVWQHRVAASAGYTRSISSRVAGGGSEEFPLEVSPGAARVAVQLTWPDSSKATSLDLELVSPEGAVSPGMPPSPRQASENAASGRSKRAVVDNPAPGRWLARIRGRSVPKGTQEFSLSYNVSPLGVTPPTIVAISPSPGGQVLGPLAKVVAEPAITLNRATMGGATRVDANRVTTEFTVRNSGGGTLNYTIGDDAAWLSCAPASGTSTGEADTITTTFDINAMDIGVNTATITVSDPDASNNPQTIAINYTIFAQMIMLNPATLTPSCLEGADAVAQTFTVRNYGAATLNYSISDDAAWLSCTPASGTATGETDIITVNYDTDGLEDGTHTATITVSDPIALNSPQTIGVTLTVSPVVLPTVSAIADTDTDEDTVKGPIAFTIGDLQTAADNLVLTKNSGNQTLVPDANIVFGGSGANRTVTITPVPDQSGTATITITVEDEDGWQTSESFVLTVNEVNDPPTISDIADTDTDEDTPKGPIAFTIGDVETLPDNLVLTKSSSNQTLVPDASIILGGTGANRTVTLFPVPNEFGTTTVTITVEDEGGLQASDSFVLTVNSINDEPVISTYNPATPFSMQANTSQLFEVVDHDDDGDTPSYSWEIDGAGTGNVTSSITYSPIEADVGPHIIKVTVSDGKGGTDDHTWNVTVTTSVPVIARSTPTLSPFCSEGLDATSQTFDVWNAGGSTLNYTIGDDVAWLSCAPSPGDSTGEHDTITVTFDTDGLASGIYNATITITAPGASNTPQTIAVTLTVNALPAIACSIATLNLSCTQGQNAAAQAFEVWNVGGATLNYTIGDDVAWLSCGPVSGDSTGEHDTITVTYDTIGLAVGTYNATITIAATGANNTPQTIAVTLTVNKKSGGGGGGGCSMAGAPTSGATWGFPYLLMAVFYVLARVRRRAHRRKAVNESLDLNKDIWD
jgi:BACON domain-containing protein/Big-like domain-containing protein